MQAPLIPSDLPALRRALVVSVLAHLALGSAAYILFKPAPLTAPTELVDIEVAPLPPMVEALPPEVARAPDQPPPPPDKIDPASTAPTPPEGFAIDAGVDAPPDAAPIDAPVDAPRKRKPDAGIDAAVDAAEQMVAEADAGTDDAGAGSGSAVAEIADAGSDAGSDDATIVATSEGSGSGSGTGSGSGEGSGSGDAIAQNEGSGSGSAGMTTEPAVDGAPTTAGTAANLLTYFPQGHIVTVLIRFDRLRGTEWAPQTERLLQPMPDYQFLFGGKGANIVEKLETLVISTPSPRDISATTLVGRTKLGRAGLRDMLSAASPVTWSTAKGGLLGKRTKVYRGDTRLFLSPFKGWFLLAQPADLGKLTTPVPGDPDSIIATGKLPTWLQNIRTIEAESGDESRGPALVLTISLGGKRVELGDDDFGLGIKALPTPDRISLAMELVKQGWLVRGNMRFLSEKDATEFITAAEAVRDRVGDSTAIQMVVGKPIARVVKNLSFARTGGRVSYTTSISIADGRAILAATAQQLDSYFRP